MPFGEQSGNDLRRLGNNILRHIEKPQQDLGTPESDAEMVYNPAVDAGLRHDLHAQHPWVSCHRQLEVFIVQTLPIRGQILHLVALL